MRPKWLLLAGVLGAIAILGVLADVALRARDRLEIEADEREARETVRLVALLLDGALRRIEQSLGGDELVPFARLAEPGPSRAGFGAGLERLDDEAVRKLLSSREATPSGLPVAVVAAITLGDAGAMRLVADRLFSGALPVRPEDVAGLAGSLGAEGDPRVEELAVRLAAAPAPDDLPQLPLFRRTYLPAAGGSVEGWSRAKGERVTYRVPFADLLRIAGVTDRPGVAGRTRAVTPEAAGTGSREVVPDVQGLLLEVAARSHVAPGLLPMRAMLWSAVGLALVAVLALDRAASRERRAAERERSFLGAVTHELRTPLTSIRMLAETLEEGRGQPAAYGALVRGECERLEAMVEQVLDASRAAAAPQLAPVEPAAIVRGVAALAAPRAERRAVTLALEIAEPLPLATWDADAVRRALLNLVDNAIKHGRAGGRVDVGAKLAGSRVELRVADDGPGIQRQDRARIFERFVRGASDAPGTGLGLYLVEQVARAHGGSVGVESVPGRGATFTLLLPVEPPARRGGA